MTRGVTVLDGRREKVISQRRALHASSIIGPKWTARLEAFLNRKLVTSDAAGETPQLSARVKEEAA